MGEESGHHCQATELQTITEENQCNFSVEQKHPTSNSAVATITLCSDSGAQKYSLSLFPLFPHLLDMK